MRPTPSPENDSRSEHARAYQRATEVVAIAISMATPPVLGLIVSRWLGMPVVWISIGSGLGLWLGLRQLLRMVAAGQGSARRRRRTDQQNPGQQEDERQIGGRSPPRRAGGDGSGPEVDP